MNEPKPCPFCGKEVWVFKTMYGDHCIRCTECGIGTDFSEDMAVVVEKWNRRTNDDGQR